MVHIYNEITIYFYKAIFASGASPPNPRWGPACPQRGYPPSTLPRVEECTYFWGVNTSWVIDTAERKKRPLHQEDNKAPQPTYLPPFEPNWLFRFPAGITNYRSTGPSGSSPVQKTLGASFAFSCDHNAMTKAQFQKVLVTTRHSRVRESKIQLFLLQSCNT